MKGLVISWWRLKDARNESVSTQRENNNNNGASRGIGRSIARGFVLAGADIVLVSRNLSALEEAAMLICPVTHEIPQKESRNWKEDRCEILRGMQPHVWPDASGPAAKVLFPESILFLSAKSKKFEWVAFHQWLPPFLCGWKRGSKRLGFFFDFRRKWIAFVDQLADHPWREGKQLIH